jgi:cytochrome c-type biogenesis protein CcsB
MAAVLLKLVFLGYLVGVLIYLIGPSLKKLAYPKWQDIFLKLAFMLHTLFILLRWFETKGALFASLGGVFLFWAWGVALAYLFFAAVFKTKILLVPANTLALLFMLVVLLAKSETKPLMPALQSNWMGIHVITYLVGYGAMALACFMSLLYLFFARKIPQAKAEMVYLDNLIYQLTLFGFPFLTIGMIIGSVWANIAWGSYWFWDPKETCSLITWLVYALYLHLRLLKDWKGKPAAYLSILGFLVTLFTFVGVNYILPGLHSYS